MRPIALTLAPLALAALAVGCGEQLDTTDDGDGGKLGTGEETAVIAWMNEMRTHYQSYLRAQTDWTNSGFDIIETNSDTGRALSDAMESLMDNEPPSVANERAASLLEGYHDALALHFDVQIQQMEDFADMDMADIFNPPEYPETESPSQINGRAHSIYTGLRDDFEDDSDALRDLIMFRNDLGSISNQPSLRNMPPALPTADEANAGA